VARKPNYQFEKRQKELERAARKEEKRKRRLERDASGEAGDGDAEGSGDAGAGDTADDTATPAVDA
jgi:hypothetical protein